MSFSLNDSGEVSATASSVSEIVRRARQLLESSIALRWVCGEVSNVTRAASGHVYFTLKDDAAQVRCVMWRNRAQLVAFQLRDGMHVEVRAQITVYEPRGEMQLSIESVRQAGVGKLYEIFLRLKSKLEAEGLFDAADKKPLPTFVGTVGVVTSPAAAALRDVLVTLRQRAPGMRVVLYPTPVQGEVGETIAAAIDTASARAHNDGLDALILCRGGGSLEDLWAFNHEAVVRALRRCAVPTVCGVGHETDISLADLAADLRAPTPTAAAQFVSAAHVELRAHLPALASTLKRAISQQLNTAYQTLDLAQHRLIHPRARLQAIGVRLRHLRFRFAAVRQKLVHDKQRKLDTLQTRLAYRRPHIAALDDRVGLLARSLHAAWQRELQSHAARLVTLESHLLHLNPESVLKRGYAIVRDENGAIVRSVRQTEADATIAIELCDGVLKARVTP